MIVFKLLGNLIGAAIWAGLIYAGCVLWPFHLNQNLGMVIAVAVGAGALLSGVASTISSCAPPGSNIPRWPLLDGRPCITGWPLNRCTVRAFSR